MMNSNEEIKVEEKGRCRRRCFWKGPFIALAILVKGGLVMLLWNALIPDLFHGPEIIYPQALGLLILVKILVGFPGGGPWKHFGPHHHRGGGPWGRGRHFWNHLSVEEREKLRERLRSRCGHKEDSKES